MSILIAATIKSSVLILTGLLLSALLRRRSASLRHWLLAASLASAACVPLVEPLAPSWHLSWMERTGGASRFEPSEIIAARDNQSVEDSAAVAARTVPRVTSTVLAQLWGVGAMISGLWLLVGFMRLVRLTSSATRLTHGSCVDIVNDLAARSSIGRCVRVLQTRHASLVATWGFFRPVVLLPPSAAAWRLDRTRVVLGHEIAHIRRGDWCVQMMAELLRVVYWFNPLLWYACHRLRQESERACDDAVLAMGVESVSYAEHLLALAGSLGANPRWEPPVPAPAILRRSTLEQRIKAMLNSTLNRTPVPRASAVTIAAAVAVLMLALAGFRASAQAFGTLSGVVVDQLNKGVAGAPLLLTDPVKQTKYEVRSDAVGRFEFIGLPPADYELTTRVPGFLTTRDTLTMTGQDARAMVTLRLGVIEETVGVVASDTPPDVPAPVGTTERLRYNPATDRCTNVPSGGCIRPPMALRMVRPFYPMSVDADGVITLNGVIGTDGLVSDLRVEQPAHPGLANIAVQTVSQWEYAPTRLDTIPVPTDLHVTVKFMRSAAVK